MSYFRRTIVRKLLPEPSIVFDFLSKFFLTLTTNLQPTSLQLYSLNLIVHEEFNSQRKSMTCGGIGDKSSFASIFFLLYNKFHLPLILFLCATKSLLAFFVPYKSQFLLDHPTVPGKHDLLKSSLCFSSSLDASRREE